jgi:kumamolisin
MASVPRVEIPGSERQFDEQHPRVGDVDGNKQIEVTVYLRPSVPVDDETGRLTRDELAEAHGMSDIDLTALHGFASEYGLGIVTADKGRRAVTLRGSVDAMARAFGVPALGLFDHPSQGTYRGRRGPLTVPAQLDGVVTGVFGIDDRPQARPRLRRRHRGTTPTAVSYSPIEVAKAYSFPTGVDGSGQAAGILELGGGYTQAGLTAFFDNLGITPPSVTAVSVDGGSNSPGQSADGEVMLDIEVLGAVAPGAKIFVYFSPNTDQGFIDAVSTAVHDNENEPAVLSISWGGPEDSWTEQARTQMELILTEAATVGVTVTVASGDSGSTDGVTDGKQHVDFPASAPHALGCGGTTLEIQDGKIASEVVWNDLPQGGASGGGISIEFPQPSYQSAIQQKNVDTGQPGRGVPDVSGNADPNTGYAIVVDSQPEVVGGTSAVAPLWAGLITLINQSLGQHVGFLQPQLYPPAAAVGFHDITEGNNPAYLAGKGWDACTGLGSPNGTALLAVLRAQIGTAVTS